MLRSANKLARFHEAFVTTLIASPRRAAIVCDHSFDRRYGSNLSSIHRGLRETQRANQNRRRDRPKFRRDELEGEDGRTNDTPDWQVSIPYTTAESEFLYGTNVVTAALQTKRRKLYKLYVHDKMDDSERTTIRKIAEGIKDLSVKPVGDDFLPVMKKMSEGRPHNGFILEASPLPIMNVANVAEFQYRRPHELDFFPQNANKARRIATRTQSSRFPLILLLDGVRDEGNLGNILRTACYLNVDAVVLTARNCAPLSAVTLKAASGAGEAIPIFTVEDSAEFLRWRLPASQRQWSIYAADAPDLSNESRSDPGAKHEPKVTLTPCGPRSQVKDGKAPLKQRGGILILGGEGEGIRREVLRKADASVALDPALSSMQHGIGLDSLNVSTAAGILMWNFVSCVDFEA